MVLEINRLCDAEKHLIEKKVVLFDLDDTLYSEKEYVRSGFEEIARQFKEIDGMARKLWNAFVEGRQAIDCVLLAEGIFSCETRELCLSIYRNQKPRISLYPTAKRLLEQLLRQGIRLGMITDGRPEGQRAKIEALELAHYFEKIIITDELGGVSFRKPNTAAFEKMQAYFNVPYEAMAYVGDNPQKDFTAPGILGMDSVYFKNLEGIYSAGN